MFGKMRVKKICKDCKKPSIYHLQTWIEGLLSHLLPSWPLNSSLEKLGRYLETGLQKLLILLGVISVEEDFTSSDIPLRSTCFIREGRKQGIKFKALRGPFGYTGNFQMQIEGKNFHFEGLPRADFLSEHSAQVIDDKEITKKYLKREGFPTTRGKSFWFFQKGKACCYGKRLGFPLVVKPRTGSVARHVTTDIRNRKELKEAINKAILYSPTFIIEKFIPNAFAYRATIIDFDFVACVQQIPANVVGDGIHTISELIDKKNRNPKRGKSSQRGFTLYKIVEDETTKSLLQNEGYSYSTIPPRNELVYLQKDPFLKLGGDLIEVTSKVHPDNLQLFGNVSKFFDVRVVGLDLLAQDISLSWKKQSFAILELNNLPCIEMHHFPSSGEPQNVAKALVDMALKYYD